VTTADGRFTAMMPHPERVFRNLQMSWSHRERAPIRADPEVVQVRAVGAQHLAQDEPGDESADLPQPDQGHCLLQRLGAAGERIEGRVDAAQHRCAERHVGADDARDAVEVGIGGADLPLQVDQQAGSRRDRDAAHQSVDG
jgi:hypothetical protein